MVAVKLNPALVTRDGTRRRARASQDYLVSHRVLWLTVRWGTRRRLQPCCGPISERRGVTDTQRHKNSAPSLDSPLSTTSCLCQKMLDEKTGYIVHGRQEQQLEESRTDFVYRGGLSI